MFIMNENKKLKVIIWVLTLTLIILATCFGLYYKKQSDSNLEQNNNIVQINTPTKIEPSVTNTSTGVAPSVTTTSVKTEPFLDLLSPKGGENLCIGENFNISWKGSKEFDTVDVYLVRGPISNHTTYPLGSFPSSYNETGESNGEGSYSWNVGRTEAGIELPPDESNRIILNGCYPNQGRDTGCTMILNKSPKPFGTLDCRG